MNNLCTLIHNLHHDPFTFPLFKYIVNKYTGIFYRSI